MDGQSIEINSPQEAIELGIGMVHQHFMLIPKLTFIETIVLGIKLKKEPLLYFKVARKEIEDLQKNTGLIIPLDEVEIIKALYKGATTLIMDEPIAVLTPTEVDELFMVLKKWVKKDNIVIFITHKMREVVEICNCISILRDIAFIGTFPVGNLDEEKVGRLMVGKDKSLETQVGNMSGGNQQKVLIAREVEREHNY